MEESRIIERVEQETAEIMNRVETETGKRVPIRFVPGGGEVSIGFIRCDYKSDSTDLNTIYVNTKKIKNEEDLDKLIKFFIVKVDEYLCEYKTLGCSNEGESVNE